MTIERKLIALTPSRLALSLGLAAVCGLGSLTMTPAAHAQTPPTAAPAATSPTTPAEVPAPAKGSDAKDMAHHGSKGLNAYLDRLHSDLKITPAEEPLWGKFADTMRQNAADLGQAYRARRDQLPTMTALEDMNSFIDVEQKRLDGMKRSSAAFADLYNAMPAAQQKAADAVFLADLPGGPHHKGHKGPHKAEGDKATPAQ
jgi:hypothetical protein